MRLFSDVFEGFYFYIKRRKKRVNNDFKGDYFIEKQEKIYVIEDEEGFFVPN